MSESIKSLKGEVFYNSNDLSRRLDGIFEKYDLLRRDDGTISYIGYYNGKSYHVKAEHSIVKNKSPTGVMFEVNSVEEYNIFDILLLRLGVMRKP